MTSRSDRLRNFLTENGPFDGSVTDLAAEMGDPSPSALSASVSVAVKDGWLRRHPPTAGAKAEWLWMTEHDEQARQRMAEAGVVPEHWIDPGGEEAAFVCPIVEPEGHDVGTWNPWAAHAALDRQAPVVDLDEVREGVERLERGPAADVVIIDERVERPEPPSYGPSPMRITLDIAPWQIRVDGKAITVREARALVRDLQTALCVIDVPFA